MSTLPRRAPPAIEYLDRPPAGWFALDVLKVEWRKWDWVALMFEVDLDVDPDELKHCLWTLGRFARAAYVRVPGKHRNYDAAWDALQEMLATRH